MYPLFNLHVVLLLEYLILSLKFDFYRLTRTTRKLKKLPTAHGDCGEVAPVIQQDCSAFKTRTKRGEPRL
jgi:hypothetical protein